MTRSRAVLLATVIVFLVLSLDHLSVFPPVGEDEPWIAAAPYKLATQGVYGSDLFAGYYGADRHNYQHMPLYPLVQAALFKTIGVGVFQMRLLSVSFGLALLLVLFVVGSRVADARVGACAAVLMLVLRIYDGDDVTGILLLDRARINRYDIAVPMFGLLAFLAFLHADRMRVGGWYVLTGVLVGLASLTHLFGVFWLPVFLVLSFDAAAGRAPRLYVPGLILSGFVLPWVPWLIYIASGWHDFVGQMRFVSSRFDLFNLSFYVSNTLHGGGPISLDWLWDTIRELPLNRPGAWSAILGLPLAAGVMTWTATRHGVNHHRERLLVVASLAQCVMFVTLLKVKTINYMIGIWPLGVLMLAWLGIWLWDRERALVRIGILVLFALIVGEGGLRMAHARAAARRAVPYDWYTSEIARCVPPGSLVLGLQHYWLGLRQYEYRTWLMATNYANPLYYHAPVSLDAAIERIDPDIVLIDRHMAAFFDASAQSDHPFHELYQGFETFKASRGVEPICAIRNRTYGTMVVYRVPRRTVP